MVFEMGKYYKHTSDKKLHIIGRVEDSYLYGDGLVGEEPDYYNYLPIGDDECSAANWHEITYSEWFNDGEQVGNVAKPDACPQLCEVTELIIDAVNIDGAHHKQWYLEQIAVKLGIELPEHEKGIIP